MTSERESLCAGRYPQEEKLDRDTVRRWRSEAITASPPHSKRRGVAEQLIVVPLHNGAVPHGRPVHLPAARIPSDDFAPYMVDARCGLRGVVYAHDGAFENAPVCPDCLGAAA